MSNPSEVEAEHIKALESFTQEQFLAAARELLASMIRLKASQESPPSFITRKESLDAVFAQEAEARKKGATAINNFFLPIDNQLPIVF